MSDIAEGLGVAIEGSLAANAVEPSTGKGAPTGETHCANCSAPLIGPYCNQCGQKAHVHRTLTEIGHDLMHGVLHLDGKLWHTLPLLTFQPGKLTRRYIEGERAKFVSPMAMLLFSVFAMFAVFQMVGLTVPTDFENDLSADGIAQMSQSMLEDQEAKITQDLAQLEASTKPDPALRKELEEGLKTTRAMLDQLRNGPVVSTDEGVIDLRDLDVSVATGIDAIDGIVKKWRKNPSLMLYKLQANGYKFSWLLVPISLPFVWLLFLWRRGHRAYDHTVFVTYSLSFMSLLFIALSLAGFAGLSAVWVFTIFATIAPMHIYKHLKHTYSLSRFSAVWRFLMLLFFMIFIVLLFLQALIVLGGF